MIYYFAYAMPIPIPILYRQFAPVLSSVFPPLHENVITLK